MASTEFPFKVPNTITKPGLYYLKTFVKDDRMQMSNFDRFMEHSIPRLDINQHSVHDLISLYTKPSIYGLKVEVHDDK